MAHDLSTKPLFYSEKLQFNSVDEHSTILGYKSNTGMKI
jgi:hypothetical protein